MAVIFCSRIPRQREREGERGGRGGNRTKVHGVVVLESERGEGGGGEGCCLRMGQWGLWYALNMDDP